MLSLVLALALGALAPQMSPADVPRKPLDPVRVAASASELRSVLKAKDTDEKLRVLSAAQEFPAPAVVKAVARGLKDKNDVVRRATLNALRFIDHPDALSVLHRVVKTDRAIRKDDDMRTVLFLAIGQHADPSSIAVLTNNPFDTRSDAVVRSRILGLGRIRTKAAVDALIRMMKSAPPDVTARHMKDYRLSLMVLTGVDRGPDQARWHRWWKDEKKALVVAAEAPSLPRESANYWAAYWNEDRGRKRAPRRQDRGEDARDQRDK